MSTVSLGHNIELWAHRNQAFSPAHFQPLNIFICWYIVCVCVCVLFLLFLRIDLVFIRFVSFRSDFIWIRCK